MFIDKDNADLTVRQMLKNYGQESIDKIGKPVLHFLDHMDDGTPIELTVTIDMLTVRYFMIQKSNKYY